jgi:hypothetical protein
MYGITKVETIEPGKPKKLMLFNTVEIQKIRDCQVWTLEVVYDIGSSLLVISRIAKPLRLACFCPVRTIAFTIEAS